LSGGLCQAPGRPGDFSGPPLSARQCAHEGVRPPRRPCPASQGRAAGASSPRAPATGLASTRSAPRAPRKSRPSRTAPPTCARASRSRGRAHRHAHGLNAARAGGLVAVRRGRLFAGARGADDVDGEGRSRARAAMTLAARAPVGRARTTWWPKPPSWAHCLAEGRPREVSCLQGTWQKPTRQAASSTTRVVRRVWPFTRKDTPWTVSPRRHTAEAVALFRHGILGALTQAQLERGQLQARRGRAWPHSASRRRCRRRRAPRPAPILRDAEEASASASRRRREEPFRQHLSRRHRLRSPGHLVQR